tara:strand:- start:3829 stop:5334 length:1506 start_codon:yes stop_codon:yes gene_type:complete
MVKVNIKFDDNFYTLHILEKQILFNYNILYILNLKEPFNFEHFTDINTIKKFDNFIIFSCKFRDNIELLELIKKQYKLQFIDFSLECFWCFTKYNSFFDENIDLGIEKYELEINTINNDPIDNYKNINETLNIINKEVINYKKIILNNSVDKIYGCFSLLQNKISLIEIFLKKVDNNLITTEKISFKGEYLDNKENEIIKTRKLIKYNDELEKINNKLLFDYNEIQNKYELLKNNNKYVKLPITINNNKEWRELAIMVHLYDINLWEDIYSFIINLEEFNLKIDLYVNISVNNKSMLDTIKYKELYEKINKTTMFKNIYYTDSDNCGMDIGGFLISYCKMLDLGLRYHQLIKIHSKTNPNWRYALLYGLMGSKSIIENNMKLMTHQKIGMLGNDKLSLNYILNINKKNYKYLYTYMKYFGIKNIDNYGHFIPGTIFWIKGEILDNFFTKELLIKCYNEFEQNYCGSLVNNREGKPHSFERFFGVMVKKYGKLVETFDTKKI